MRSSSRVLPGLLLGVLVLFAGQGVFLILIPLYLAGSGFSAADISAVGSAYFIGVAAGAWFGDRIVRAVGNVRAFAGSVALILCAALSLSLAPSVVAWAGLRFIHGAAAATTFLAIESWLHAATQNEKRGRVIGAYTALTLIGLGAGQFLVNLYGAQNPRSVTFGAILFALSIAAVAWSRADAPAVEPIASRSLASIYRHSPLSLAGCLIAGLTMGAFWALGPVFCQRAGLSDFDASLFMAAAILGGLSLVWPLGRVSDFTDRRLVVAGIAGAASVASFAMASVPVTGALLIAFVFLYGGVIFSLYPLSVSHAADHLRPGEDMLMLTRGLLLANAAGMATGPVIAGRAIDLLVPSGFFYYGASMTGLLSLLAIWRIVRRGAPQRVQRKPFAPLMESMPVGLAIVSPEAAPGAPPAELALYRATDHD